MAHSGSMVALVPNASQAAALAALGTITPAEVHLTVLYLGPADDLDEATRQRYADALAKVASVETPIEAVVSGLGHFDLAADDNDGMVPCVALIDGPGIGSLRLAVCDALGVDPDGGKHDMSPHISLDFHPAGQCATANPAGAKLSFGSLRLVAADEVLADVPLAGKEPTMAETPTDPGTWQGLMLVAGIKTGDGRRMSVDGGSTRELPLSLRLARSDEGGHWGAVPSGSVTAVDQQGAEWHGSGVFDSGDDGQEHRRLASEGTMAGLSVDLDDVEVDYVPDPDWIAEQTAAGSILVDESVVLCPDGEWADVPYIAEFTKWRIAGLTGVSIPAFEQAKMTLVAAGAAMTEFALHDLGDGKWRAWIPQSLVAAVTGSASVPLAASSVAWDGADAKKAMAARAKGSGDKIDPAKMAQGFFWRDPNKDDTTQGAYKLPFCDVVNGELTAIPRGIYGVAAVLQGGRGGADIPAADQDAIKTKVSAWYNRIAKAEDDNTIVAPWDKENAAVTIIASVQPYKIPPATAFDNPRLADLTPLTITSEGLVFGHLAPADQPHRSFSGVDITVPLGQSYEHFHQGFTECSDGTIVRTGNLVAFGGHPDVRLSADAAKAAYDDSKSIWATVRAGEDDFGVWVAGAVLPDVDEFTIRRARACCLSGDWRPMPDYDDVQLIAALSVPTGGFPILPRVLVADGKLMALVAGGPPPNPTAQSVAGIIASIVRRQDRLELDMLDRDMTLA